MEASSRSEFELKACASPEHLISRLNYCDESKLREGKDSAGPNEDMDADFSPHYESVLDYVTSSKGTADDIPQQLQAMLDEVKSVATSANTNVYKAADILETISDAIQYGRDAAKDHFSLDGKARLSLDSFDKSFKKFLQDRMSTEVELADQELTICKQYLEEAISFARNDIDRQQERNASEDELVSLQILESTHEAANRDINEDEKDLTAIMEKCSSDIAAIDKSLRDRESAMGKVQANFDRKRNKRDDELKQNRQRQDELNEELQKLEEREDELVKQNEEEANKQKGFNIEYQGVVEDITQWKAKIEQLNEQAQASLKIIETMKGFTSLVMKDAKRRKKEWKLKLSDMELTNCLQLRDSLMAMGSIHLMEIDDCKTNVTVINTQISRNKEEKKTLALTGYKEGVYEAEARLKKLQDRFEEYKNRMKEHEERVAAFKSELTGTDERIHQLKPNLQLDSLEERYSERRRGIDLVFKEDRIDAATFCSHGSYES